MASSKKMCTTVDNGMDALKIISSDHHGIDLVLLDIMMPEMSGYEVCTEIRKRYSSIELPVILLTAKGQLQDSLRGFEVGANDYVLKVS